jgi:hypothetical protein
MYARLAGVIRGAETTAHHRRRAEMFDGTKPQFGDVARDVGEAWEDDGPAVEQGLKVRLQERLQQRYAEEGVGEVKVVPVVK